jgi:hypothetical protein
MCFHENSQVLLIAFKEGNDGRNHLFRFHSSTNNEKMTQEIATTSRGLAMGLG